MSYIDGFPQTSLNLAIISTLNDSVEITISIRSSNDEDEKKWISEVKKLSEGMDFSLGNSIPYFTYKKTKLRVSKLFTSLRNSKFRIFLFYVKSQTMTSLEYKKPSFHSVFCYLA